MGALCAEYELDVYILGIFTYYFLFRTRKHHYKMFNFAGALRRVNHLIHIFRDPAPRDLLKSNSDSANEIPFIMHLEQLLYCLDDGDSEIYDKHQHLCLNTRQGKDLWQTCRVDHLIRTSPDFAFHIAASAAELHRYADYAQFEHLNFGFVNLEQELMQWASDCQISCISLCCAAANYIAICTMQESIQAIVGEQDSQRVVDVIASFVDHALVSMDPDVTTPNELWQSDSDHERECDAPVNKEMWTVLGFVRETQLSLHHGHHIIPDEIACLIYELLAQIVVSTRWSHAIEQIDSAME